MSEDFRLTRLVRAADLAYDLLHDHAGGFRVDEEITGHAAGDLGAALTDLPEPYQAARRAP